MKQLTVISGKGGTGKTSITASLAVIAKNVVVADCDVDAPDLHMLLHPQIMEKQPFKGSKLAAIDSSKCTKCGLCRKSCRFDAISDKLTVDSIACEGCGVCALICPATAITLKERVSGNAYISTIPQGFMSHALLNPGEGNSGKLVTLVRQNAKNIAITKKLDAVIIDGSPGIGCPVIASISGVDAALVVTEPTLSGIHDLKRVLGLLNHFKVKPFVCINMHDINSNVTGQIQEFCRSNSVEVLGLLPYDKEVTEAMVNGKTIVEYSPESKVSMEIKHMWTKIAKILEVKVN
jgi:MinD superfamily P-loop ATPase